MCIVYLPVLWSLYANILYIMCAFDRCQYDVRHLRSKYCWWSHSARNAPIVDFHYFISLFIDQWSSSMICKSAHRAVVDVHCSQLYTWVERTTSLCQQFRSNLIKFSRFETTAYAPSNTIQYNIQQSKVVHVNCIYHNLAQYVSNKWCGQNTQNTLLMEVNQFAYEYVQFFYKIKCRSDNASAEISF